MSKKTRYRCKYCGTDDICDTLPSWDLLDKRCEVCNHGKFVTKAMPEGDVDYYDEKPDIQWSDYSD